ncbi:hypothetical protein [Clostridium gasigenes]|nr:hypothetical protein [Clostridium gasigenes]
MKGLVEIKSKKRLMAIYLLLFMSEVVHDKFLNSRFDFYDMLAL